LIKRIFSPPLIKEGQGVDFNIAILTSFISILITNFAGFSVVITSLFFFLLPLFTLPELPLKTDQKPKSKLFLIILVSSFLFLVFKILSFLVADIAYNQSQAYLSKQQLSTAKQFINLSIYLRPKEAIYHSQAASIASKNDQVALAVNHSNISLTLSPASTNLWKERAQLFSELSTKDPAYFVYAIDALEKSSRLAPSDAKIFYLLGKFYEAASKNKEATKNYLHALLLKPNYDHASFALGERYFNDKNYEEAKKYFEITLQYAPTNPDAKNYLEKIISLSPKSR
jgi:tetratricopeptide (TPR) repeat protein